MPTVQYISPAKKGILLQGEEAEGRKKKVKEAEEEDQ